MTSYPVFGEHQLTRCNYCHKPPKGRPLSSGYAHGNGGWCQNCRRCGRTTHYDIRADVDAARAEERAERVLRRRSA